MIWPRSLFLQVSCFAKDSKQSKNLSNLKVQVSTAETDSEAPQAYLQNAGALHYDKEGGSARQSNVDR